jgi:hypothetical protein
MPSGTQFCPCQVSFASLSLFPLSSTGAAVPPDIVCIFKTARSEREEGPWSHLCLALEKPKILHKSVDFSLSLWLQGECILSQQMEAQSARQRQRGCWGEGAEESATETENGLNCSGQRPIN